MRRALWLVPVAIFFLNPGFACGPPEPQFQYGADEMRAAVEGNWSFTIIPEGSSSPTQVTVHVEQSATAPASVARAPGRAFIRAAYACGTRTLFKSAGACIDVSDMPLAVTFVSGDAAFSSAALAGDFKVYGTAFSSSNSQLQIALGGYEIDAQLSPDGTLVDARVGPGASLGSLLLATRS
jgi:hypothetical protein